MQITGGELTEVTTNRLFYMNDTMAGQSGSPVYTWYKGYWTVLGVHSYGSCPNSAPRFTSQMIYRFLEGGEQSGVVDPLLSAKGMPDERVPCGKKRNHS